MECLAVSSFCRQLRIPELEDCDDVVADLLMVILPQNRGSLRVHGLSCYSASSVLVEKTDAQQISVHQKPVAAAAHINLPICLLFNFK